MCEGRKGVCPYRIWLVGAALLLPGVGGTVRQVERVCPDDGAGVRTVTEKGAADHEDRAMPTGRIQFVERVYPAAKALWEKRESIHPVFVTAQAALETGWKLKTDGTNNLFGMTKGCSWQGEVRLCLTDDYFCVPDRKFDAPERVVEVEKVGQGRYRYRLWRLFRVYGSMEGCLSDHLALLRKPGYADAWPYRDDPREFARRISDSAGARYATAPDYAETMAAVIDCVEKIIRERMND
jgi:flagellar protein FlgJ